MSSGKNIAIVCNYNLNPQRIGGMDRFFLAYNEALVQKGYNPAWFFSGGQNFQFYSGLELHLPTGEETAEALLLDFLKAGKRFEFVVTHFLALCTPFFREVKKYQKPYIIAVDHNPKPLHGFPWKKRVKNRLKGQLFSKYIDCFVGVSQYTADCIIRDYGTGLRKKTEEVYNGIDTSVYSKRKEENFGKFIVASHLRESKGIRDLIEAVNLLFESEKKLLKIDIFGEGPQEIYLKELVGTYHLEGHFNFKGSSPQLPELFQNYSFLLQPTYMECFSLSILESLAANVPVITTTVGGNPEVVFHGKNGFLFQPGNIKELKELLQKVLQREIGIYEEVNGLIESEYNLDKMVANHVKLLPCI